MHLRRTLTANAECSSTPVASRFSVDDALRLHAALSQKPRPPRNYRECSDITLHARALLPERGIGSLDEPPCAEREHGRLVRAPAREGFVVCAPPAAERGEEAAHEPTVASCGDRRMSTRTQLVSIPRTIERLLREHARCAEKRKSRGTALSADLVLAPRQLDSEPRVPAIRLARPRGRRGEIERQHLVCEVREPDVRASRDHHPFLGERDGSGPLSGTSHQTRAHRVEKHVQHLLVLRSGTVELDDGGLPGAPEVLGDAVQLLAGERNLAVEVAQKVGEHATNVGDDFVGVIAHRTVRMHLHTVLTLSAREGVLVDAVQLPAWCQVEAPVEAASGDEVGRPGDDAAWNGHEPGCARIVQEGIAGSPADIDQKRRRWRRLAAVPPPWVSCLLGANFNMLVSDGPVRSQYEPED